MDRCRGGWCGTPRRCCLTSVKTALNPNCRLSGQMQRRMQWLEILDVRAELEILPLGMCFLQRLCR